jgi:hypothetical protein
MAGTVRVQVEGLAELQKKLKGPPRIYEPPIRKAQASIARQAAQLLRGRAFSRRIKRSIRPRSRSSGLFTAVEFNPVSGLGKGKGASFRAGWAYDNSPPGTKWRRGGHTPGMGMGYQWISGLKGEVGSLAASLFAQAAKETERDWSR